MQLHIYLYIGHLNFNTKFGTTGLSLQPALGLHILLRYVVKSGRPPSASDEAAWPQILLDNILGPC